MNYALAMSTITLEYPPIWLPALGTDAPHFESETKLAAAMKLFECGRLSSGQAAQLAGISRPTFLLSCRQWGVDAVVWDADELDAEFTTAITCKSRAQ
jgi:predicted HTH domain antitoxin